MNKEQKFYNILQDLFVGAKLEGDSGYMNLMNIKTDYFNKIKEKIKKEVKSKFDDDQPEDLFDKLYTFFDSYFSDGGAIFFSSTPVYKNIYAKVYSDREDTALFWKTAKLYYVKSEANYKSIKNLSINSDPEIAFDFDFDASLLKHKQGNEKKDLEFYFIGTQKRGGKKIVKFRVLYKKDNKYTRLQEILKTKDKGKIIKYLLENIEKLENPKIILQNSGFDFSTLSDKDVRDKAKVEFIVSDNKDLHGSVSVEPAISEIGEIEKYFRLKSIALNSEEIEKAFKIYKKQTEIDYFIHKDAKRFLYEQFDLYMYQHLTGSMDTIFSQESLDRFKKIKDIAYLAIEFIGNFEDELKKIWLKPKFARNSNYVLTLDRIDAKDGGAESIVKILKHKGLNNQIAEWQELGIIDSTFNQKEITKEGKMNRTYQFLPIDTKYFKDLEIEIIGLFDNLDEELDGRLIKSDNFQALNTLLPKYKEQVQTIYIDPPFNTGDDFDYVDRFQDSTWLSLMENRLELSRKFLKNSGSFFLHLDQNANFFGRILLNKIFQNDNFRNEIFWHYTSSRPPEDRYASKVETIFFYAKGDECFFDPILEKKELDLSKYPEKDKNGHFKWVRGIKKYFKEYVPIDNNWHIPLENVQSLEVQKIGDETFKTQKPVALIKNILLSSSNSEQENLVFDFFSGSGTTLSVAHRMNRKWLGVEIGEHFYNIILPRMKKTLFGINSVFSNELKKENKLNIGGFFKYYDLEQYEDALKKAVYTPTEKELHKIDFNFAGLENGERAKKKKEIDEIFSLSEKLADKGLEIDLEKETARFVFEKLYSNIDIAETISNLFGKKIKKISKDKVIFEGDFEVDLNNLDFKKYESLKKLIYW